MLKNGEKVIAIIPARGGSKGIPHKNLVILGNKPLFAWPLETAKKIPRIDRVIVSTDDEEIAERARNFGAEVPFIRPSALSQDDTPSVLVLKHTVEYFEKSEQWKADIIICLYPTCPFIRATRIENALDIFETKPCNSIIGVQKDWGRYWKHDLSSKLYRPFYPEQRINRQYYQPLLKEAGNIYFSRYNVTVMQQKLVDDSNVEFIYVEDDEILDIDSQEELMAAQTFVKERNL